MSGISGAVDALGIISGILGIAGFLQSQFGGNDENNDTGIQIALGSAINPDTLQPEADSPGGAVAYVAGSDATHNSVGSTGFDVSIGAGETHDFGYNAGGADTVYVTVMAQDDICVAWTSVTYNNNKYAFMAGDIFEYCDVGDNPPEWYYSAKQAGMFKDPNSGATKEYIPQCAWLDGNTQNGHRYAGFQARMSEFQNNPGAAQTLCRQPVLNLYTQRVIVGGKRDKEYVEAAPVPKNYTGLVISDIDSHSAVKLCEAKGSRGPDFVSLVEGIHCDMSTREVMPLCGVGMSEDCFAMETSQKLRKRGVPDDKTYSHVNDWTKHRGVTYGLVD